MISIHKLNRVLAVDQEKGIITVEAGMDLHTLHQVLKNNGMALSNLGSISDQSVAGVMATASHGTGTAFGSLPTMVSCFQKNIMTRIPVKATNVLV